MKSFKQIVGAGFGFLKVCSPKRHPGSRRPGGTTVIFGPQGLYFLPNESRPSGDRPAGLCDKI